MNYVKLTDGQILKITRFEKKDRNNSVKTFTFLVHNQNQKNPEVLDVFDVVEQINKKYYFSFATEPDYVQHIEKYGYNKPYKFITTNFNVSYDIEIFGTNGEDNE